MVSPFFKRYPSDNGPSSNWSERHIAYACGQGTFSLSDGLITERGIAHRCGNVVTDLVLPPSPRTAKSPFSNCLFYLGVNCRSCIERCPAMAITEKGHDKIKCAQYLRSAGYSPEMVGFVYDNARSIAGCGLCQTKVPCEFQNPAKKLKTQLIASVMDVLVRAYQESDGKTIDLVIEHGELKDLTLDMMQWWKHNVRDSERYRMWHPEDHVSFEWELPPAPGKSVGAIRRVTEKIGEFPASMLRIRAEDPRLVPVPTVYRDFRWSNILGPGDIPISQICHEYEATRTGIKMRSTFRFPAKTPESFLRAMEKHCREEMGRLAGLLPELYRASGG
jgi:hypothetical protein